jgi:hypothetical protein
MFVVMAFYWKTKRANFDVALDKQRARGSMSIAISALSCAYSTSPGRPIIPVWSPSAPPAGTDGASPAAAWKPVAPSSASRLTD